MADLVLLVVMVAIADREQREQEALQHKCRKDLAELRSLYRDF